MATIKPVLFAIAGAQGAGKSTFTTIFFSTYTTIDTDAIAAQNNPTDPTAVLEAAEVMAQALQEFQLSTKSTFGFQTLLNNNDGLETITEAKQQGYHTELFFLSTENPAINIARIAQREAAGGRGALIPLVMSGHAVALKNARKAVDIADNAHFYDTTQNNKTAKFVAKFQQAKLVAVIGTIPKWFRDAFNQEINEFQRKNKQFSR